MAIPEKSTGRVLDEQSAGPFVQVRGAMYALRDHLSNVGARGSFEAHVWGYGVITPECDLRIPTNDPEVKDWLVLGEQAFPSGISNFIEGLAHNWRRERSKKGYSESLLRPISPTEAEKLLVLFRPAIGYIMGLGVEARRIDREIRRMTSEQAKALDLLSSSKRIVLRGSAGTGKTILAIEQARRKSALGQRVLFVCFNRSLADVLRTEASKSPELRGVEFHNYHQLVGHLLARGASKSKVPEDWAEFNKAAAHLVLEAIDASPGWKPFDYLVVDEAQDLMANEFLSVLDLLLEGGLEGGQWTMCFDPTQAIFKDQFDHDCADRVAKISVQANLTINCRNTHPIQAYVYGLAQLESGEQHGRWAPHPTIIYYRDRAEMRQKRARRSID